ncbi:hypothetical protein [Leifsonia sp. 22587]|uniref:hypothetical protein n=1 Tax=Leifsonia sp. 22587 TaxID=3453946 RepID=UPI003F87F087
MPPMDPNRTLDGFQARLVKLEDLYQRTYSAVQRAGNELELRKGLAADFGFRLGGEWELFQHRWYIAAISKRPSKFVGVIQKEIDELVDKGNLRSRLTAIRKDSLIVPTHPTAPQIAQFVDPKGYNVTFDDTDSWLRMAQKHLHSDYTAKVAILVSDAESTSTLDLLRAIRNRLAHGSDGSGTRLNAFASAREAGESEGLVGPKNDPLVRKTNRIDDVATYLHAAGRPSQQRVLYLSQRVRDIAEMLRK